MRLRVLGSNGTYPTPGRPGSGYLVEHGATRIWVDTGPGTFVALWDLIDPMDLDAVVISHRHTDHSVDLLSAFHAFAYGGPEVRRLPVFAPEDAISTFRRYVGAQDLGAHMLDRVFDLRRVDDGDSTAIGDVGIRFASTVHSVPNLASRYEAGGRILVYTGDTGPDGDWPALVSGAHLFLCEASLQQDDEPYRHHLTALQAGGIARSQGAERLVLTHIPPHRDPARSVVEAEAAFDRPVDLAVPGTEHDV